MSKRPFASPTGAETQEMTRREFVKRLSIGAAGLGLATILPSGIITAVSAASATATAERSKAKVTVNKKSAKVAAYTIEETDYFALRDLANALNGTDAQFSVSESGAILAMVAGKAYTAVGGEGNRAVKGTAEAELSQCTVKVNGDVVSMRVYVISDTDYVRMNDIALAIGFSVEYNGQKDTFAIDTKKSFYGDSGIFLYGQNENMDSKSYTLEFVQPIQMVAIVNGKEKTDGTWRSSNKHLVSVDPDGTIIMRDGVGGYDVTISWTFDDITYSMTVRTGQLAGARSIEVDRPINRGDFMIRLAEYFGWFHYNGTMDDGTDIDKDGNLLTVERVRGYYDVTGDNDYVKAIECALDMGVLTADSPQACFYPLSDMTREDAAVILCKAFLLSDLTKDYISSFVDAGKINASCYQALNTLVGKNYMRGRTNTTLNPTEGITETETRIILEAIDRRVVAPVWAMPVSHRKFVRVRPRWFTPTEDAVVHYRCRAFHLSHPSMEGLFVGDRGVGVTLSSQWGDWVDYIPGYSSDTVYGLNNNYDFPYENVYFCVEVQAYATKPSLEQSPVSTFVWRIDRPAWHDFATDKLHEGGGSYPTVYRFFDNFQAAAYYIEGAKMGILYDGLMPTNTNISLLNRVKELATKPFVFVLGHNHVDHKGAMAEAYREGIDIYVADRVGPQGTEWTINVYGEDYTSANTNITATASGIYQGAQMKIIDEGYVFDLGNCKFTAYRLPGHCDDMIVLHDPETGLLFSSDIYGVNRHWVADQFSAKAVRQDLILSLQQQLMDAYTKDGGQVKEVYTGHNRIGVGFDYMMVWEQCLQDLVNYGPDAVSDDRRGEGAVVAKSGNSWTTLNWTAFSVEGKQIRAEYTGAYDGKKFYRFEVDNRGTENALVESNLYFDYRTNAQLSNITFHDAALVGHDFKYKAGQDTADDVLEDGRLKYVLSNKFVPFEYEYEVKISAGQSEVTFTPTAMSERITGLKVNGIDGSSRCPVTVKTNSPATIVVTGPDGSTTRTYTLKFISA